MHIGGAPGLYNISTIMFSSITNKIKILFIFSFSFYRIILIIWRTLDKITYNIFLKRPLYMVASLPGSEAPLPIQSYILYGYMIDDCIYCNEIYYIIIQRLHMRLPHTTIIYNNVLYNIL
jgi:hypothetical protein